MAGDKRGQRYEVTVEGLPEEPELNPGAARALLEILLKARARLQEQEATATGFTPADAGSTARHRDVR